MNSSYVAAHSAANKQMTPAQQIDAGFRQLRFADGLEAAFREHYNERYLFRLRVAALMAVVIFAFFGVLNYFQLPGPTRLVAAGMQLLVICPLLVLVWWATYWQGFRRDTTPLALFGIVAGTAGLLTIMFVAHGAGVAYRYEGLMLITMYVFFLSGLLFRVACAVSIAILFVYVVGEAATGFPTPVLTENSFYLTAATVIGIMGCYAHEYSVRQSYLYTALLEDRAQRDGLTGLHNRRYLEDQMPRLWRQALRGGNRVAAALIDVDFFKAYNDTYGHLAGDDCLREVGRALQEEARRPLDLVVRYGGEEFLILWFALEPAEILPNLTERVRMHIKELRLPHEASQVASHVTVSCGAVATIPGSPDGLDAFLARADSALYQAKLAGRDKVVIASFDDATVMPAFEHRQMPGRTEGQVAQAPPEPADLLTEYRHADGCMYRLIHQLVLVTDGRRGLLTGTVATELRRTLRSVCSDNDWAIRRGCIDPHQLELVVETPPEIAAVDLVNVIREHSAQALADLLPGDAELWAPSHYLVTLGEEDQQAVSEYVAGIEAEPEPDDNFRIRDA